VNFYYASFLLWTLSISPHFISSCLTSPHLISPHTLPYLTSPHLTSPHLTSPHLISSHLIFNALWNMKWPHQPHTASVFRKKLHVVFPESVLSNGSLSVLNYCFPRCGLKRCDISSSSSFNHVRVKLSHRLINEVARHEDVWWSGVTGPRILNLGTWWRLVASFTNRLCYPRKRSPQYSLDRRLGRPQNQSGRCVPAGNRTTIHRPRLYTDWTVPCCLLIYFELLFCAVQTEWNIVCL
jgi:hypothetical protein